jgi:hypothetical protein
LIYDLVVTARSTGRAISMAVTSKTETKPVETKPAEPAAPSNEPPTPPADPPVAADPAAPAERPKVESDCVVKSDMHVGRAVNGKVCSYHAMHYDAAGKRRK